MTLYQHAVAALLVILIAKAYLIHHDVLDHARRVDFYVSVLILIAGWSWLAAVIAQAVR